MFTPLVKQCVLRTLAITALIALAADAASDHQYEECQRVSIVPGENVPIYGHDGKPYISTWGNTVPNHQKRIADAKGKAPYERVSGLVEDIRTIDGVVYYGLDAFPSRTKWFTAEYLAEYVAPPGPTQEEIDEKERKKQEYEALLESVPQPNWLNKGCTYHVKPCRTECNRSKPVKEGDYKVTLVFQGHNSKDGKWLVALDWTDCIDPNNIDPKECIGAKCGNCFKSTKERRRMLTNAQRLAARFARVSEVCINN